jgi:uncharacterized protein
MSAHTDLIRGGYKSFAALDIDDVLARFSDQMTWTVPPVDGWGGTFTGKDEILGFFGSLPVRYGAFEVDPQQFHEADDALIVLGEHLINGDRIPFAHVWTFDGDLAASFTEYLDNAAFAPHVIATA